MRILVTGANRGIGLEFTRQYAAAGHVVYATCRRPVAGDALHELAATRPGILVRQLDVVDDDSVRRLVDSLDGGIDVLINNAGSYGSTPDRLGHVDTADWLRMFEVNTVAPLRVTAALLPALRRGHHPKVVGLSSVKASIGRNHMGAAYQYRSTKAAMNAVLRSLAVDLAADGICVVAISPGWIYRGEYFGRGMSFDERLRRARSYLAEFGGSGAKVTLTDSVASMIATIDRLTLDRSGEFLDHAGGPLPW